MNSSKVGVLVLVLLMMLIIMGAALSEGAGKAGTQEMGLVSSVAAESVSVDAGNRVTREMAANN